MERWAEAVVGERVEMGVMGDGAGAEAGGRRRDPSAPRSPVPRQRVAGLRRPWHRSAAGGLRGRARCRGKIKIYYYSVRHKVNVLKLHYSTCN